MSSSHDLSAIFDEHVAHEFVAQDIAATMRTMAADPFVNHVPTSPRAHAAAGTNGFGTRTWVFSTATTAVASTAGRCRLPDDRDVSPLAPKGGAKGVLDHRRPDSQCRPQPQPA
jgi:carboxymethylenebutenolidase